LPAPPNLTKPKPKQVQFTIYNLQSSHEHHHQKRPPDRSRHCCRADQCRHADCCKKGDHEQYTAFDHPLRAARLIEATYDRLAPTLPDTVTDGTTLAAVRTLCSLVKSHMGRWNFDHRTGIELPRPLTPLQRLIHTADYLASRKQLLPEHL